MLGWILLLWVGSVAATPPPGEVAPVDHARAARMPRASLTHLTARDQQALRQVTVPVLATELPAGGWRLVGHPHWYSLSTHGDGIHLTMHGSRLVQPSPAGAPTLPARPDGPQYAQITRTHGIVDVTFNAFGVAYHLAIECEAPLDDPRCTQDRFARSLLASLARVSPR